jgi:spoIIIJ-associated protein
MPPDERRVIHLALASEADITTNSIGEGEERKVVISLA